MPRPTNASGLRDRLIEYYLLTAEAADEQLRGLPAIPVPEEFTDRNGALAWLDAERLCLVAMVRMAADTGREQAAMSLPLLDGSVPGVPRAVR